MTQYPTRSTSQSLKPQNLEVAILGYGSQGRAHALNLRDSGARVHVGLRPGVSWQQAQRDGFHPLEIAQATSRADLIALLLPDMVLPEVFDSEIAPHLRDQACLLFAHGFNIHYGNLTPPTHCDVVLVAPKGPGSLVRRQYEQGSGVPSLLAVHQDASGRALDRAKAYAFGLGSERAGVLETTFAEETETDLFGEQAVLCGGLSELIKAGYETLVDAGYQPEVAYFECLHEVKLIVDLIHEGGFAKMLQFVSDTACYGDFTRGPRVIDESSKERMKEILKEIQDGRFAREWEREYRNGLGAFRRMRQADLDHPIEGVGERLRSSMSWLNPKRAVG